MSTASETEEERADREAAGLTPGEEWECWWERCWFCPHALKTVDENVAGVCAPCQAKGLVFPTRPHVSAAEARATLERLVREEVAKRGMVPTATTIGERMPAEKSEQEEVRHDHAATGCD